jgi:hypothetical protein
VGDTIAVSIQPDSVGDWAFTLEYVGGATVSPRGEAHEAGEPYDFSYGHFEPRTDWTVRIFTWSDSTDPRTKADAFAALLRGTPAMTRRESRIDYEWYRPTVPGIPLERWALDASASVDLSPGTYTLRTISDDAMRVWVDDSLVVDHWTPHESTVDLARISGGMHRLRVQYYQVDGWTEARVEIVRGDIRSVGVP